jgi:hypothetical protein
MGAAIATSSYDDTVFILDVLGRCYGQQVFSVLDVGAGFGRWGFLLRCHFGCGTTVRVGRGEELHIEAIEAHVGNVSPICGTTDG